MVCNCPKKGNTLQNIKEYIFVANPPFRFRICITIESKHFLKTLAFVRKVTRSSDCSHFSTRPFSSLKLFMTHYIREFCVFVHAQNDMMKNFKARGKKLLLFRRKKSEWVYQFQVEKVFLFQSCTEQVICVQDQWYIFRREILFPNSRSLTLT